jgi:hypothetical protein
MCGLDSGVEAKEIEKEIEKNRKFGITAVGNGTGQG